MNEHIVIVTGASPLPRHVVDLVDESAIVLAADGGLDLARAAGLHPSGLIGDLDSISPEGRAWAESNATVTTHASDKDQTDTELTLAFAADMQPERLTLIGGGDRLDHTLAALGALAAPNLTGIPMLDAWWDGQHVDVLHGPSRRVLHLEGGSTLSLLALGGLCRTVHLRGVRWTLDGHDLDPVVGLGVSNEVTDPHGDVHVSVSTGVLTVFDHPRTTEGATP